MTYYEFELDSTDGSYAFSSSYTTKNWPTFLLGGKKPLENLEAIKIVEVQIPFSWYTIKSGFTFDFFVPNVTVTKTIPPGNYTITQLVTLLNSLLVGTDVWAFTVSFNQITQKIEVVSSATTSRIFSFTTTSAELASVMGLTAGVTSTSSWNGTVNSLSYPNCCAVTGPNYLYINSSKIGNLTNCLLPKSSSGNGNSGMQIAKIPVNVQPGGVIYWQDPVPEKWFSLENLFQLTEIDLFITVGNNPTPVDLNGLSFSVKFAVLADEYFTTKHSSGADSEYHVVKKIKRT